MMRPEGVQPAGTGPETVLRVAAEAYYWKPGTAWFRALELTQYERGGVRLESPVLDLGCGDGRVAWMLARLGRLGAAPVGTDFEGGQLRLARRLGVHAALLRSDGGRLPFADGVFRSILCNGVVCSIPGDFRPALGEIRRVLESGGRAVITVPTDRFNDMLLWPSFLGRLSPGLRRRYETAMDARQPHFWKLSPDGWRRELEKAGLEVVQSRPFFRRAEGGRYNILAMHIFRFLGILRTLGHSMGSRTLGPLVARWLREPLGRARNGADEAAREAGYVLFEVRRP